MYVLEHAANARPDFSFADVGDDVEMCLHRLVSPVSRIIFLSFIIQN
jgi:hypothetical protein